MIPFAAEVFNNIFYYSHAVKHCYRVAFSRLQWNSVVKLSVQQLEQVLHSLEDTLHEQNLPYSHGESF